MKNLCFCVKSTAFFSAIFRLLGASLLLVVMLSTSAVQAADEKFPAKAITIVLPYAAGSGGDRVTRLVALFMEKEFNVPFVVLNIAGAGGIVGASNAFNRAADGYTLLFWASTPNEMNTLVSKTPYKVSDWVGIGATSPDNYLVVVGPNSPWKTLKEAVTAMKASPDKFTTGGTGPYGGGATGWIKLSEALGISARFANFGSTNDAKLAVLSGQLDFAFLGDDGSYLDLHKAGKLRILGIMADEPLDNLRVANIPTIKEATGVLVEEGTVRGFVTRSSIPPDRLRILQEGFQRVVTSSEFKRQHIEQLGSYRFYSAKAYTDRLYNAVKDLEVMVPKLKAMQ